MTAVRESMERMSIRQIQEMVGSGQGKGSTSDDVLENRPDLSTGSSFQSGKPSTSDDVLEGKEEQTGGMETEQPDG